MMKQKSSKKAKQEVPKDIPILWVNIVESYY